MVPTHEAPTLRQLEAAVLKTLNALVPRDVVAVVRYVVDTFAVCVKELLKDVRPQNWLDDLIGNGCAQLGEADAQREGAGLAAVGLVCGVGW